MAGLKPGPRPGAELIYGRQAVRETLRAGRRKVEQLFLARGLQPHPLLDESLALAHRAGASTQTVAREQLDGWLHGANHQGLLLAAGPYPYADADAALALAKERDQDAFFLLLDRVQDPQNLGTLLRTAEACGVHGIILPRHRAAEVTPAVVSASAGAVEHLLVCQETNLVTTMRRLKTAGLWIAGLEAGPHSVPYTQPNLAGPLAVVVGSEGFGLGRLVAETCDWLLKLPMLGRIDSLNAAVAGSILLYHILGLRSHPAA
jgi:23S rRNA (guanosine2251-2'-O)-methyltransferase